MWARLSAESGVLEWTEGRVRFYMMLHDFFKVFMEFQTDFLEQF